MNSSQRERDKYGLVRDATRRSVPTKTNYTWSRFVNVIVNAVLNLLATVRIQVSDSFAQRKSQMGGYRIRYGSPLKCPVNNACGK